MKKFSEKIFIFITLLAVFTANVFAVDIAETQQSKKVIVIGYIEGSSHIVNNSVNSVGGVGFDYFNEMQNNSNMIFEHIQVTAKDGFDMLLNKEIDLLGPVSIEDDYIDNYVHTSKPITGAEIVITAPLNSGIAFNDFEQIENSIIAVEDYGYYNEYEELLLDFAKRQELDLTVLETTAQSVMAWDMQADGYDMRVSEFTNTNGTLEVVANLGYEPLHYIALNENSDIILEIDEAMQNILTNDYAFSERLNLMYTNEQELAKPAYSVYQTKIINSKNEINVFYEKDNMPFQWQDENGDPQGISVEVMNIIAEDLGITVNYINSDSEGTGPYNSADVSLSLLSSSDYSNKYKKTNAYANLPVSLIGEPKADDNNYLYVSSLPFHDTDFGDTLKVIGSYIIVYYNTVDEIAESLSSNRVDFVISPSVTNDYILSFDNNNEYFATQLDYEIPLTLFVSDDIGEEYIDIFNIAIQRIDATTIEGILAQSRFHYIPEDSFIDFVMQNIFIILVIILAIICAFIFIVWSGNLRRQKDLLYMLNHDRLTGLCSKYSFFEKAKKLLENAKPNEYSLYFIDIDNFKLVNESFGYNKGTQVIKQVAQSIKQSLDENSIIAREANDKFIFITPNIDKSLKIEDASKQEMYFRLELRKILADDYSIHVSIGKYVISDVALDLDYMLDCANYARILAKNRYGTSIVEFTKEMQQQRTLQNEIVAGMETALFGDEFEIFYQPKVDLKTMQIVGAEALVRWMKNGVPVYFPDQFIPIFEGNRFIIRLDYFVTQNVCKFIKQNYELLSEYKISINMSGLTLLNNGTLENLMATIENNGVSTKNLEFEVTESAFVENFDLVVKVIKEMKEKGLTISMDDFGSGLSTYNRFKDIPLDVLKLDKGFCSFNNDDSKGTLIIESIIQLSKQLKIDTVAEGVETKEQAQMLKELGCDIAQGYLYAKPMPASNFLKMIENKEIIL